MKPPILEAVVTILRTSGVIPSVRSSWFKLSSQQIFTFFSFKFEYCKFVSNLILWAMKLKRCYRVFSHDVTAAMLVSLNNGTVAMFVYPTNPKGNWTLFSCKHFLLLRWKNKVTDHVSENTLRSAKTWGNYRIWFGIFLACIRPSSPTPFLCQKKKKSYPSLTPLQYSRVHVYLIESLMFWQSAIWKPLISCPVIDDCHTFFGVKKMLEITNLSNCAFPVLRIAVIKLRKVEINIPLLFWFFLFLLHNQKILLDKKMT